MKELLDEISYILIEEKKNSKVFTKIKFLCLKNLGLLEEKYEKYENALNNYVQACVIDSNDITLWIHLGSCSLECKNYRICKYAFEKGLTLHPSSIICLEGLIDVNYIIGNYEEVNYLLNNNKEILNCKRMLYYHVLLLIYILECIKS